MLKERSGAQALKIYDRLRRTLEVEDGGSFSGVMVELSEAERDMYNIDL